MHFWLISLHFLDDLWLLRWLLNAKLLWLLLTFKNTCYVIIFMSLDVCTHTYITETKLSQNNTLLDAICTLFSIPFYLFEKCQLWPSKWSQIAYLEQCCVPILRILADKWTVLLIFFPANSVSLPALNVVYSFTHLVSWKWALSSYFPQ